MKKFNIVYNEKVVGFVINDNEKWFYGCEECGFGFDLEQGYSDLHRNADTSIENPDSKSDCSFRNHDISNYREFARRLRDGLTAAEPWFGYTVELDEPDHISHIVCESCGLIQEVDREYADEWPTACAEWLDGLYWEHCRENHPERMPV